MILKLNAATDVNDKGFISFFERKNTDFSSNI